MNSYWISTWHEGVQCNIASWWCDLFLGWKMQIHPWIKSKLELKGRAEESSCGDNSFPGSCKNCLFPLMSFSTEIQNKWKKKKKTKTYIRLTFLCSRIWKLLSLSIKSNKLFYYILYILDSTQIWKEKKKKIHFAVFFSLSFTTFYKLRSIYSGTSV